MNGGKGRTDTAIRGLLGMRETLEEGISSAGVPGQARSRTWRTRRGRITVKRRQVVAKPVDLLEEFRKRAKLPEGTDLSSYFPSFTDRGPATPAALTYAETKTAEDLHKFRQDYLGLQKLTTPGSSYHGPGTKWEWIER